MSEAIEGTIVEEGSGAEIAVRGESAPTLFGTTDPGEVIARATAAAQPLARVVRAQQLATNIQGREHVRVEGWTLLGSMLGVFPVCVWSRPILSEGKTHGWEARVEARTRSGDLVGAAEAQCTRDENTWSWHPVGRNGQTQQPRDDYALRSMAQTRATSKALRAPLGFVMQLAGFEATPAEEMPADADGFHGQSSSGGDGPKATEKQLAYLRRLMDERSIADVGKATGELTKQEASKLIEDIKAGTFTPIDYVAEDDIPF